MDALAQVKGALDAGLISAVDYEQAKAAFLRAQQIRSGFEAGLLTPDDAEFVKRAFISSLDTLRAGCGIVPVVATPSAAASAPIAAAPERVAAVPEPVPAVPEPVTATRVPVAQKPAPAEVTTAPSAVSQNGNAPKEPEVKTPAAAALKVEPKEQSISSSSLAGGETEPKPETPTAATRNGIQSRSFSKGPKKAASKPSTFGTSVSGMGVAEECAEAFSFMKTRSAHKFITYKIDQADGQVVLDVLGEQEASYESFTSALPDGDCRFAVYDYEYTNADGCRFDKIVFVMWSPDNSPLKNKMIYASTKDFFRQHLDGIGVEMQVTDHDEISFQEMRDKVSSCITRK